MSIADLANPLNLYDVDITCDHLTANHVTFNDLNVNTLQVVTEIITGTLHSIPTGHVGIEIVNQASPLVAELLFIDNTVDSSASVVPLVTLNSNQLNSTALNIKNSNAASTSNSIIFRDNNNNVTLQTGSNNVTHEAYVLSSTVDDLNIGSGKNLKFGSNGALQYSILQSPAGKINSSIPMSISFPGYDIQAWNLQTVGLSNLVAFTITPASSTNCTLSVFIQGRVVVGANVGDCRSTQLVASFRKDVGGAVTQNGGVVTVYTISDASLAGITFTFSAAFGQIFFAISGPAGYTNNWSGIYTVTTT